MKKILFAISAALLIVAGCSRIDEGSIPAFKNVIKVSSDEGTRTEIVTDDDVTFRHVWVKDDAIALFDARTILKYEMVGEGGSTVADFSGDAPQKQDPPYYAFYPYSDNIDIYHDATNQSKFLYDFPAKIECKEGSTMAGSNVMVGFTDGKNLQMKNACSYVRISLSSPFLGFMSGIEITARGGEYIAGPHLVGIDPSGIPFTEPYDGKVCSNKVFVSFPSSHIVSAATSYIYIPLPAVDLSQGLSFVLHGDFGGEPTINLVSSTATLERNNVLVMEEYRLPSEEAKIGETVYETVGEAFAVANASDDDVTITLLRSCVAAEKLNILSSKGKGDVTLNLNGKSLTVTTSCNIVVDNRHFTVTDLFSDDPNSQGTILSPSSNTTAYPLYIQNGSHLDWKKGNLLVNAYRGIYVTSQATATLSGGTIKTPGQIAVALGSTGKQIDIEGDIYIYSENNNAVYLWGGVLNVTGGKLHNTQYSCVYAASAGSVANVSGGYVSSGNIHPVSANSGKAYVTGGCFNRAVTTIYSTDESGSKYLITLNEDPATSDEFPFAVVPKTGDIIAHGVRTSYEWDFATLESGAKNASRTSGNNTLTLLTDVTTDATLEISNRSYTATLDLNGKKITSSASPAISNGEGTLVILDSTTDAEGEVLTTGQTALEVKGNTTINGGSLSGAADAVKVEGGKFKVMDGWFYGGASSDVSGSGTISLAGGYYRNKPNDSHITEEDIAAIAVNPAESHNGRKYSWIIKRSYTILTDGITFNTTLKNLANSVDTMKTSTDDLEVNKVIFKVNENLSAITGGIDISSLKDGSVMLTYDSGTATVSTNYPVLRSGEDISYMFSRFKKLKEIVGFDLIDTRLATNARNMFYCNYELETVNVSKMKTSNITNMTSMFCYACKLKQEVFDFKGWNTSNVEKMNYMFDSVQVTTLDLTSFNTAKVNDMSYMFAYCRKLTDLKISSFNTSNVMNMSYMFRYCSSLETLNLANFDTSKDTTMAYMFANSGKLKNLNVSSFNTENVLNMNNMFACDSSITEFKLSHFKTPKVYNFQHMFYACVGAKEIDMKNAICESVFPGADKSNGRAFTYMFYNCVSLEKLDLRSMVYPGRSTYAYMFYGCVNMKELHLDKFGDIGTMAYVNYYHYFVGYPTSTGLADNRSATDPCYIYTDNASLIRQLMFNRSYTSGSTPYYNYAGNFRNNTVKPGKVVFKKTGFNNPWTFASSYDYSGAPTIEQIIAPTE